MNYIAEISVPCSLAKRVRNCGDKQGTIYTAFERLQPKPLMCGENYLGLVGLLFISPDSVFEEKALNREQREEVERLYEIPLNSFIRGIGVVREDKIVVYYDTDANACKDFWSSIVNSSSYVSSVSLFINNDCSEDSPESDNWIVSIEKEE